MQDWQQMLPYYSLRSQDAAPKALANTVFHISAIV